ncbi:Helicase, C-terminal [Penicillium expansum]|uniref:Helicase, C-terminal n=1 Tax=Penicillium expansum TaxID=27334 RepID=A0A0A2II59_PENEN|nr:Helicase, C-terminal [Penicillium expansum]KGO39965.1 Helicase, C-terminal [Penicillium expansum]KGO44123.1 Helicase, C-terminal [Penicillium expansum]KGO53271.1 Helicase, C-terminal [Penicillium expansum]
MNPHVLRFEGQPNDESIHYSTIPDSEEIDPSHSSRDETLSDDVDGIDMDDMFGPQLQHIFQTNVPVDRRIKSDLLQHQKEAIGFISQLFEAGIDAGYSYQHVFNGERCAKPQEARGGILADEMGLGKSLVTLAVIAGSLDEAERFAGRQEQSDVSQKKNLTQATLIVVPSTSHYIRNRTTKQFQAVVNLSSQHRWCLTGTPIQNSIEDLGALVAFLRVPILDRVAAFRKFISTPTSSGKKDRFHNLQTLLHAICIRRTRDVLNLPEPTTETRKLPMSSTEKTQYRDLLHECMTKIDMAMEAFTSLAAVICVVFSSWKKTLYIVAELLSSNGIRYSMIEGSLSLSKRLQELQRYQNQKETNVLLMTLGTGAVGLNLTTSSRIYLLEPQWNPSIEAQAIGRALRLGQVSNVTIIRYIMEGTVEEVE